MKTELNIINFQSVTKFDLISFLEFANNFFSEDYQYINSFFSGETEEIDIEKFKNLEKLTKDSKELNSVFLNYSKRLSNCGQWELMELLDDLLSKIEKINKLYKFRNTSKTKKGYKQIVQIRTKIGGYKDIETVSKSTGENDWISLMRNNDLAEKDWEIDEIKDINIYVDKNIIDVNSILGELIGEKVYGVDIKRKLTIKDNDLELIYYVENLLQKIDILSNLNKGDVPENVYFGKTILTGENRAVFSYNLIAEDIKKVFLQNDLFESINIQKISEDENNNVVFTFDIKTKFNQNLIKNINI